MNYNNIITYTCVNSAAAFMELTSKALDFYRNRLRQNDIYQGIVGGYTLAKEFGYDLAKFKDPNIEDVICKSYYIVCIRFYELSPTITEEDWIFWVRKGMAQHTKDMIKESLALLR